MESKACNPGDAQCGAKFDPWVTCCIGRICGGLMMLMLAQTALADPLAHIEARADQARAKYDVSGNGVIVAVFDRGIDWRHDDFRNADGTTRIEGILDLSDDTGQAAPNNPYGVGTLYTRAEINAALSGTGPALATRDAVGHGTATAGGCCGNGRASTGGAYIGIAPRTTLLIIKSVSEGAPAHGSVPAEARFNKPERLVKGIQYVKDTAARLGQPAVMLWNFGSIGGPTDGSGVYAETIDGAVGPGIKGLVQVTGTGDDGGADNHAFATIGAGAAVELKIQKGATNAAANLRLDLWYPGSDLYDVTVVSPTATFGPYVAPPNNAGRTQTTAEFTYYHNGAVFSKSGKRQILVDINGPAGTYTLRLANTGTTASTGFHASLNPSRTDAPASLDNKFLTFAVPGYSIWSGAAAKNNIAPNDYYFKPWQGGAPGTLWPGSSIGPTYDERTGVDVSAPGEGTIVALGADSYWSTFAPNIPGGNGKYTYHGAVSGAAPVLTGVIALMLEKSPQLDAVQVKSFLRQSARTDANTGATPNSAWGFGKLDALAALDKVAAAAVAVPVTVVEFYNASLDHYFITWVPDEIAKLDNGTFKGWARTALSFKAYVESQGGTSAVCRIYIPPGKGDGHYFGRDPAECDGTMTKNPTFILESSSFFHLFPPNLGNCGSGTVPVYRVFSNRADANHRYTTDRATRDLMVAKGWLAEGDGADTVVMCAPQ